jgi:hypothetical protein
VKKDKSDELLEKAITFLDNKKPRVTDGEDDIYCKHLAFQLKGLPDRERRFVKFKIQEMIFNVQSSGMNFPQAMSTNSLPIPNFQQFRRHLPSPVPLQAEDSVVSPRSPAMTNCFDSIPSPSYQINRFA